MASGHRTWLQGLLAELARDAGVRDPVGVGRRLALLYDGALIGASMDGDPAVPAMARGLAERLLDEELGAVRRPRSTSKRRPRRTSSK